MKKKISCSNLRNYDGNSICYRMQAATTETTTNTAESSDNKGTEDTTAESAESTDDSDSSADADKEDSDEEDVTYGEVKSVEDGKITIAVGTMKDMGGNGGAPEKPDENGSGDASADTSDAESTEPDSKDGDSTDNGEAPEKPDGDNADGNGNGGAPGGDQGEAPSMLDLTGDEMTVTVTDDTVITKRKRQKVRAEPQEETREKPRRSRDGDNGNNQAPGGDQGGAPDGNNSQSETIELSDIQEGDIVAITTDDDGNALTIKVQSTDMGGGQGGPGGAPGGQSQGVDSYDTANTYDSDTEVSDTSLESTGTDENAALVSSGANVTFNNMISQETPPTVQAVTTPVFTV